MSFFVCFPVLKNIKLHLGSKNYLREPYYHSPLKKIFIVTEELSLLCKTWTSQNSKFWNKKNCIANSIKSSCWQTNMFWWLKLQIDVIKEFTYLANWFDENLTCFLDYSFTILIFATNGISVLCIQK